MSKTRVSISDDTLGEFCNEMHKLSVLRELFIHREGAGEMADGDPESANCGISVILCDVAKGFKSLYDSQGEGVCTCKEPEPAADI